MGEGDFARLEFEPASENGGGAGSMMRRAEGALSKIIVRRRGEGMNLGDFDLFFGGGRREKVGGGTGEQSFAGAGWSGEEEVMATGDGNE